MQEQRRNTYKQDENLEHPFNIKHLMLAGAYIGRYKWRMIGALTLSGLSAVAALFAPRLTQKALDEAIPNKDLHQLVQLGLLLIGLYIISVLLVHARTHVMIRVNNHIIYDIRKDLFAHLQELSFQYFDDRPHGKILIRVVNYVNSVSRMLGTSLVNLVLEFVNLFFIVIFMFLEDVELSLVVLAGVPFLAAFLLWIKKKQRIAWQRVSNKNSNLNAYLQESISGVRVTQNFAREEENAEIFEDLSDQCRKSWLKATSYSNLVWPGINSISVVIRAAIYVFALLVFVKLNKTVGVIVAIASYASRFWEPILTLGDIFNEFINNMAYLERIFETMNEPVTVADAEDASEMPAIKGAVEFDHVHFSYEPGKEILHDVSFKVNPGESVALVGPTGAGKSTVVNLISRFYNVDSGRVLIDGQDISQVTLKSLRSQMGIMMQDSFIFSDTIAENIRYGKLDATDEEIEKAAKTVCADRFISTMAEGYQTTVHERGSLLSQGQKQLVSFARTLLSDPAILILDEATSSIDVQTEKALQEGLNAMLKGRTSFIIAHRLSTIRGCDRIMYISDGGITESGNHEELMALRGDYYRLYTAQLNEVLSSEEKA